MKKRQKQRQQVLPERKPSAANGGATSRPHAAPSSEDRATAAKRASAETGGIMSPVSPSNAILGGVLAIVFGWAYWPVLRGLVQAWESQPDYSHGWLVVPAALCFVWVRRVNMPRPDHDRDRGRQDSSHGRKRFPWGGLALFALSLAVWLAGSILYVDSLQAWSIPLWVAGVVWLLAGWKVLVWGLPAVVFLFFMIPLPFKGERVLSVPLQSSATELSCWILQCLGEPAISEGNIVLINDVKLSVVEACSGLRIFVSIMALAYAYLVVVPRPWWTKLCLVLSILPVSLFVNALRIAVTGLLKVHVSSAAGHDFGHDMAGWLMLPLAAALLGCVIWFVGKLIVEVQAVSSRELLTLRDRANA